MVDDGTANKARLGDLASFVNGDRGENYPSPGEFVEDGVPFVSAADIADGRVAWSGTKRITSDKFDSLRAGKIEAGDLLFCLRGSLGKIARIEEVDRAAIASSLVIIRPKAGVDRNFIYYVLSSSIGQRLAADLDNGSVQPNISVRSLQAAEIPIAPLSEQRAIAQVLGTLDDKIELNRRMNGTLEAMAHAIFKSWFVDFDPVRAQANGEPPESICNRLHLTADLLNLFPDRLVDSELGEIPEGWAAGAISDHCHLNEKTWTEKTLPAEVHYVDLANVKNGVVSQVQIFSASNAPSRARRVLRPGDTIVGTVRPGNRSFALIGQESPALTGSTGFAVLTPKRAELREFVYLLATREENISRLSHLADGAAYPAVRPEVVTAARCVVPSMKVIEAFHEVVSSILDRQIANRSNDTTVAAIRDSLLPKLLTGELRVPLEGAA